MPVSTRAQFSNEDREDNQAQVQSNNALRNPHHGLKEKLKSLTLLYEQHKLAHQRAGTRDSLPLSHANIGNAEVKGLLVAIESNESTKSQPYTTTAEPVMTDISISILKPTSNAAVARTNKSSQDPNLSQLDEGAKENAGMVNNGLDRITGFSCPRRVRPVSTTTVARKLSLGLQTESKVETPISRRVNDSEPARPPASTQTVEAAKSLLAKQDPLEIDSRIMVFVRLRPMMRKEKEAGAQSCVKIINRRDVYLTEFSVERDYLRLNRLRGRHFTFDASFPESTTQQEVYSKTTSELVEAVLQGRNGSVFCYGATGAGKTYTMLGTVDSPGVMVLAIKDLFTKIRQRSFDGNHVVQLSYLEVYNETVRDLLSPGRPLVLREDKQGIVASGLTQYRAYSTDEVMALLLQGNKNRTTEPTRANETSSRSHAILQVKVEYRTRDGCSTNIVNRVGKLSLIDLAGSERALATDQRTARSLEGANINRSLLALSSCINALVEGRKHIPYRNSKLTQLLKNSLGGACNTVMIANISPSNAAFGETQNTLHWADRTKEIRNQIYETHVETVPESERDKTKLLLEVQEENRELRVQVARQQQKLLTLKAQCLAASDSTSPIPSSAASLMSPQLPSSANPGEKRNPPSASLIRGRNCFTPEPTARKIGDETVREVQRTVKRLEAEIERMSREHKLQMRKKNEIICELSRKVSDYKAEEKVKQKVTRASVRPKVKDDNSTMIQGHGEVKTAGNRFQSPGPKVKKRSFWDIATANSPTLTSMHGRKTKSYVTTTEASAAPSMLLQPGFARLRQPDETMRRMN